MKSETELVDLFQYVTYVFIDEFMMPLMFVRCMDSDKIVPRSC